MQQKWPKIVLVAGSLEAGGAERVMSDLANYWAKRGWAVTLATWSAQNIPDFYALDPRVHREWLDVFSPNTSLFSRIRSNVDRVFKLRRLFRKQKPDAVLSFIDVPNLLTLMAATGLNLRVVVSERGCPDPERNETNESWVYSLSGYWKLLRRLLYRRASVITALNHDSADWIAKECGVQVQVIPVAVRDLANVVAEREPMILAVGRLHAVKGFDVLLRSFAQVRHAFPPWRVVIIGRGPEGAALVQLCAELGISERVTFMDPVKDIETWMVRASIVVLPSRSEAFGNVVLESMAMGTPVISTNCAGPKSLINDGINGRLVPIDDVGALTLAMMELMGQPALRQRIGLEASRVRDSHRQSVIMEQWETCLVQKGEPLRALD